MTVNGNMAKARKDQKFWGKITLIALLAGLSLALIFGVVNYIQGQRQQAAINQLGVNYEQIRSQKKDLCSLKVNAAKPECLSGGDSAQKIVKDTIRTTVPIPGIPGPRGLTGDTGPSGITPSSEFLTALAERAQAQYCSTGRCTPLDGKTGAKGDVGSTGATGDTGPVGATGAKGDAGPKGDTGNQGATGVAGTGVTSFSCDSATPITFNVTLSDGSTQTFTCGTGATP